MPNLASPIPPSNSAAAGTLTPYKIGSIQHSSQIALIWDAAQIYTPYFGIYGNTLAVSGNIDQDGLTRTGSQNGHVWSYLIDDGTVNLGAAVYTTNADLPPNNFSAADFRWRHGSNDTCNFLFVDGHCESLRLRQNVNADLKCANIYVNTH